jgi:hypothetical protein
MGLRETDCEDLRLAQDHICQQPLVLVVLKLQDLVSEIMFFIMLPMV